MHKGKVKMSYEKILIMGNTKEGKKFRPSDWAERLYYTVAEYNKSGKAIFNPLVNINHEEKSKCFVISSSLRDKDPMIFDFLIDFAITNKLETRDQDKNLINLSN
tara:strand:- start:140 stop:454 length:315 start_codon:yes stop_codon:yes gene_type:complete